MLTNEQLEAARRLAEEFRALGLTAAAGDRGGVELTPEAAVNALIMLKRYKKEHS